MMTTNDPRRHPRRRWLIRTVAVLSGIVVAAVMLSGYRANTQWLLSGIVAAEFAPTSTAAVPTTVLGLPVDDVDLAVADSLGQIALLLRSADSTAAHLHLLDTASTTASTAGTPRSANLKGSVVVGVDPLAVPALDLFAAAIRTGRHAGTLHLWLANDAAPGTIDLPGRPVRDVDLVATPNDWIALPVQDEISGRLIQVEPLSASIVDTALSGYIQPGVDVVVHSNGDLLIPTIDGDLAGSYVDRVEPATGRIVETYQVPGLLVGDQDLVLLQHSDLAMIATSSFDGQLGFLAIIDFATGAVRTVCLPGKPVPGDDPQLTKLEEQVVLPISNRAGLFDRLAMVDLASMKVGSVDLPDRVRADSDVVLVHQDQFAVIAAAETLVRVRLDNQQVDLFPLPGFVPGSTDLIVLPGDREIAVLAQGGDLFAKATLVRFDVSSGTLEQLPLPGALTAGVDALLISRDGPLLYPAGAADGAHTLLHRAFVRSVTGPALVVLTKDPARSGFTLSTWEGTSRRDHELEGFPQGAVDLWHPSSSTRTDTDQDFLPLDGYCSADDSNKDENGKDPDDRNGGDDPEICWIPGFGPAAIDEITATGRLISPAPHFDPDDEGTAVGYDDILFVGGRDSQGRLLKETALVDPYTRSVRTGPPMSVERTAHLAKSLPNGDVLIAGGRDAQGRSLKQTELFDGRRFTPLPDMGVARSSAASQTLQQCGNVLVSGGNPGPSGPPSGSAEIFNRLISTWQPTGDLQQPRSHHQMVVASSGAVLVFGGENQGVPVAEVERYDPERGTFEVVGQLIEPRSRFAALALGDDRAVLVGGRGALVSSATHPSSLATVELWDLREGAGTILTELPYGLEQPVLINKGHNTIWVAGGTIEGEPSSAVHSIDLTTGAVGLVSTTGPSGIHYTSTTRRKRRTEESTTGTAPPETPIEREPVIRPGSTTHGDPVPLEPDDQDDQENPSNGPGDAGDPVHLNSGEFFLSETDYMLSGRGGMDLSFIRSYRSRIRYLGVLGHNWDHNYNERMLLVAQGHYDLHSGGGAITRYTRQPDGTLLSPPGSFDELNELPVGGVVLRSRYGFKKTFGTDGRLLSKEDRYGNQVTLEYNPAGRLEVVRDPYGRALRLTYQDDLLTRIEDFGGRTVVYQYNGSRQLVSVTTHAVQGTPNGNDFPFGKTTRYTYSCCARLQELNNNLLTVTRPNEVASGGPPYLINSYGEKQGTYQFDKVTTQRMGGVNRTGIRAGGKIGYQYQALNQGTSPDNLNIIRNRTTITDGNGNVSIYEHNARGAELRVAARSGNHRPIDDTADPTPGTDPTEIVVSNEYNPTGQVVRQQLGEGNEIRYTYDENNPDPLQRGNVLRKELVPDQRRGGVVEVQEMRYEPIFNQLVSIIEAPGNDPNYVPSVGSWSARRYTTTYTYDYQEGTDLTGLAGELNRSVADVQMLLTRSGIAVGLGDVNGDGRTDQLSGNVIIHQDPSVLLPDWSTQRLVEGGNEQPIRILYTQNDFGQVLTETDPAGVLTRSVFYPNSDPDGDGQPTDLALPGDGGYLKALIRDAQTTPTRQSSVPPAALSRGYQYDQFGYLTGNTDGRNNTSRQIYNQIGQVVRSISAAPHNYEIEYFYDHNDNLIRLDIENKLEAADGSHGAVAANPAFSTLYGYDILDQVVMVQEESTLPAMPGEPVPSEAFRTKMYSYDANGNEIEVVWADGTTEQREFDAFDRVFKVRRAAGTVDESVETFHYDRNNNRTLSVDGFDNGAIDSLGGDPTFRYYDGHDRLIGAVDALGNVNEYTYDVAGRLLTSRRYDGQDGRNPDRLFVGHGARLLESEQRHYDEASRSFATERQLFEPGTAGAPRSLRSRVELNRVGLAARVIDAEGEATTVDYDGLHRAVRYTDPLGNSTEHTFDGAHNIIRTTTTDLVDPSLGGGTVQRSVYVVYDTQNRPIRRTGWAGDTTYQRYDSRANLIWQADSRGPLQADPMSIVPVPINAPGNETSYFFNAFSLEVGKQLQLRADGQGDGAPAQPPANPDGRVVERKRYDDRHNLVELTDDGDLAPGSTTTFIYDRRNRVKTKVRPDGTRVEYRYDADSNLLELIDGNQNRISYQYDDLERKVGVSVARGPGIEGTTKQTFRYEGRGLMTSSVDNNDPADPTDDVQVDWRYDSLGRLLETRSNNRSVSAQYADDDHVSLFTHSDRAVTQYSRDANDRVVATHFREQAGVPFRQIMSYRYSDRTRTGAASLGPAAESRAVFDSAARPIRVSHFPRSSPTAPYYDTEHIYEPSGKRRASIRHHQNDTGDVYRFDSAGRLVDTVYSVPDPVAELAVPGSGGNPELREQFDLDGSGNIVAVGRTDASGSSTETYVANAMNELREADGTPLSYNADGLPAGDGSKNYTFDAFGRLRRVTDASTGQALAGYRYDTENRRRFATYGGAASSSTETRELVYWGAAVVEEWLLFTTGSPASSSSILLHRAVGDDYRQFADRNDVDSDGDRSETLEYWVAHDLLDSAVFAIDAAGTVLESYRYDAYGTPTILDAAGQEMPRSRIANRDLFTGYRYEFESGLYHAVSRDLDPRLRRFVQRDGLGLLGGSNLYQYAGGDPVNFVDLAGTSTHRTNGSAQGPAMSRAQLDQLMDSINQLYRAKGLKLFRDPNLSEALKQEKLRKLDETIFKLKQSVAERYNATRNQGARKGGWQVDWDGMEELARGVWAGVVTAASFVPIVGDILDGIGVIVGFDVATLDWLSPTERAIMAAALVIGSGTAAVQALRAGKKALRAAEGAADGLDAAGDAARASRGTPTCSGSTCRPGSSECFAAGTQVWTSTGPVAIETVRRGDNVLAWDPVKDREREAEVEAHVSHEVAQLRRLELTSIDGKGSTSSVDVTPEHPFWVSEEGWLPAGNLRPGDVLVTMTGGRALVRSNTSLQGSFTVYNLNVEDVDNYHVGPLRLRTHNVDCTDLFDNVEEATEALKKGDPEKLKGVPTASQEGGVVVAMEATVNGKRKLVVEESADTGMLITDKVQKAVDDVRPTSNRPETLGGCAEQRCADELFDSGTVEPGSFKVGTPLRRKEGKLVEIPPCDNCQEVLPKLGIDPP